jgi:carboxypeptidase C (cathepsin A)
VNENLARRDPADHQTNTFILSRQFQNTGDFIYPNFRQDLEYLLDQGLRINLFYGDADYICNWFGGEAVSLALNYTHAEQFAAAGYEPFTVDGTEYGEVRQYGNCKLSFTSRGVIRVEERTN